MPCGRKRKRHKIATHKRKKSLRKNRHKKKNICAFGLLAQLDRAPVSGTGGPRFESWIAHHSVCSLWSGKYQVGVWRSPASALPWGGRGRWFESSHPDHL